MRCSHAPEENLRELSEGLRAQSVDTLGLVAISSALGLVGWMKLLPRAAVPKLRALPVYRSLDLGDDHTTFSIACLLVHPAARRQGVARALVRYAPRFVAQAGGSLVEAYPRRSTEPLHDEEMWQGPEQLFATEGFKTAFDDGPYPVVRRAIEG